MPDLPERIAAKIVEIDGHWLWTGARTGAGYGNAKYQGRWWGAHRLVKTLLHGAPDWRHEADHLPPCPHKHCVNPDHIEWVPYDGRINSVRHFERLFGDRTECRAGHPWPDNLYTFTYPSGRTYKACRLCRTAAATRSKHSPTT